MVVQLSGSSAAVGRKAADPTASVGHDGPAICVPTTDAATSGGSPAALEARGTKLAGGTLEGEAWSVWAAKGASGGAALEDGGVVFGGREYGLCPGYPNPSETEMIDTGRDAVVYGVVNYPGRANLQISTGEINSFAVGTVLPAPHVEVLDGVSFYIGALPQPACSYHFFEVNTTSRSYSAEHNIGFAGAGAGRGYPISGNPGNSGGCVANKVDPISFSQGIWQLPPGRLPTAVGGGGGRASAPTLTNGWLPASDVSGGGGVDTSDCAPQTLSGSQSASALEADATEVASGNTDGHSWSWSKNGHSGATGLEQGGVVIDGVAHGLCPGFPNPAEMELLEPSGGGDGIAYGVIGYPGSANVDVYQGTVETFDTRQLLASTRARSVNGVGYFITALSESACDVSSVELNTASTSYAAEHNLGFSTSDCKDGQLVPISWSQGIWQLPTSEFPNKFQAANGGGGGRLRRLAALGGAIECDPRTDAAASGGPATTIEATATQVASGTVAGQPWTLWSKKGQKGSAALEDAGLVLAGKAYGLCPGFPNPAELEIVNPGAGANGIVFGVSGYNGPATVKVSVGTLNTFKAGKLIVSQQSQPVDGTTFFIGELPASACSYRSAELDVKAGDSSSQHNLGFGDLHCRQTRADHRQHGVLVRAVIRDAGSPRRPARSRTPPAISIPTPSGPCRGPAHDRLRRDQDILQKINRSGIQSQKTCWPIAAEITSSAIRIAANGARPNRGAGNRLRSVPRPARPGGADR